MIWSCREHFSLFGEREIKFSYKILRERLLLKQLKIIHVGTVITSKPSLQEASCQHHSF